MKKLKALLINGSPRSKGCTYTALTELKNTLEQEGMEVELIHVGHKDVHGCIACRKCKEIGKCVFDDIVNEVAPKFNEADAFVIGAPVYYASPAGGAIAFLDRLFYAGCRFYRSLFLFHHFHRFIPSLPTFFTFYLLLFTFYLYCIIFAHQIVTSFRYCRK